MPRLPRLREGYDSINDSKGDAMVREPQPAEPMPGHPDEPTPGQPDDPTPGMPDPLPPPDPAQPEIFPPTDPEPDEVGGRH